MVFEYIKGGELFNLISKKSRLNSNETCLYLYQIINAVEYLHLNKISHRDLKPENILLSSNSALIKVIDFGLATETVSNCELSTQCGSPNYSSPEMLIGNKYDGHLVDIWSIGIIAYVMICGYLPFEDSNEKNLIKKILKGKYDFPYYTPFIFRDFIKKTLIVNPKNRMTIHQMKEHTVYKHGKALFFRENDIYQENNTLNPIIHEETFKRTIEYLSNHNIIKDISISLSTERDWDEDPVFKIVYDKILTCSNWKRFLLDINDRDSHFNITEKKENKVYSPQDIIRRLRMLNINERYKSLMKKLNKRNERSASVNSHNIISEPNSEMNSLNHTIAHEHEHEHEVSYEKVKKRSFKSPNPIHRTINLNIVNHHLSNNFYTPRGKGREENSTSLIRSKKQHKESCNDNIIRNNFSPVNYKVINHKHHLTDHTPHMTNYNKRALKIVPLANIYMTLVPSLTKHESSTIKTNPMNKIKPLKTASPSSISISLREKNHNSLMNSSKQFCNYYKASNTPKVINTHFNKHIELSIEKDTVALFKTKQAYDDNNTGRDKKKSNKIIRKGMPINTSKGRGVSCNHYLSHNSKISLLNYFVLLHNGNKCK